MYAHLLHHQVRLVNHEFEIVKIFIYPLFHFLFAYALEKVVDSVEDGWGVNVIHGFGADR